MIAADSAQFVEQVYLLGLGGLPIAGIHHLNVFLFGASAHVVTLFHRVTLSNGATIPFRVTF